MNWIDRLHYRTKLTLIVSTALLLLLAGSCLLFARLYNERSNKEIQQRLQTNLNNLTMLREHLGNQLRQDLVSLATDNTIQLTTQLGVVPQLKRYLNRKSQVMNLPVIEVQTADARPLTATGPLPAACRNHREPHLVLGANGPFLCAQQEIIRDNILLGTLTAGAPLTLDLVLHQNDWATNDPFFITVDNRVVLSTRTRRDVGRTIVPAPSPASTLKLDEHQYSYASSCHNEDGHNICGHTLVDLAPVKGSLSRTIWQVVLLSLLFYGLTLLLLRLFLRSLVRPLHQLTRAARQVETGQFNQLQLDLRRQDEFGILNRAFTRMAETQMHYSSQLEAEVRKRTAELEKVNETLRQDILARQKAERDKAKLEEQLRQTQKMEALGTLAGGIAHDFNNLLMPILCLTELVEKKLDQDHPGKEMLGEVLRAAHRGRDLVSQILAFSRPGKQKKQPINLSDCVRDTIKLVRAVTSAGIAIHFEPAAEALWIHGNSTQVQQMLLNLCTNATQAMGEKGTLEVRLEPTGNETIRLVVKDDGPGMSEEVKRRIFDPFFTTKPTGKGTGMGLAVVHSIVQHHNGSIEVHSTPGQGACFTISLPRCCMRLVEKQLDGRELPTGTENILVVDDEEAVLRVWEELLTDLGYQVSGWTDPVAALEAVSNGARFNLLITDQNMPHLSGSELALKLRSLLPDIPVIICTGYSENCSEADARLLGFDAHLTKPCPTADLAMTVREVLDRRQPLTASA